MRVLLAVLFFPVRVAASETPRAAGLEGLCADLLGLDLSQTALEGPLVIAGGAVTTLKRAWIGDSVRTWESLRTEAGEMGRPSLFFNFHGVCGLQGQLLERFHVRLDACGKRTKEVPEPGGTVTLEIHLSPKGRVTRSSVRVRNGIDPVFRREIQALTRKARFAPAKRRSAFTMTLRFEATPDHCYNCSPLNPGALLGSETSAEDRSFPYSLRSPKPADVEVRGEGRSKDSVLSGILQGIGGFRHKLNKYQRDSSLLPHIPRDLAIGFIIWSSGQVGHVAFQGVAGATGTGLPVLDHEIVNMTRRLRFDPVSAGTVQVIWTWRPERSGLRERPR